ncbi:Uu.00g000480.m01.CDS01 [Anthostomella pinea]|uniref:Uu.00g000480.m01.CDS01 n=1 Tax=Anthostomella pinea TaxID=933095 RepID=A0AAI8VJ44_9PEZI|nr:Uu.00g000480.m01.CDS01 [Anthostomella pinea]
MAPKRKRDILQDFDPNKSDSGDENFEPEADRPPRSRKKSRPAKSSKPSARRHHKYRGSDIEVDEDDISDSGQGESFHEDDSEDEDEELPINQATGRRVRKAAARRATYKESSEDEDADLGEASDDKDELVDNTPQQPPRQSKIIKLKIPPASLRKTRTGSIANAHIGTRRSTRARTADAEEDEDVELVELSNSGRHAKPAQSSKSKSPETSSRGRASRAGKGPNKSPPPPIEEEDESPGKKGDQDLGEQDIMDIENPQDPVDEASKDAAGGNAGEDEPMDTVETDEDGDDDEDDVPITRRTRGRAAAVDHDADLHADADADADGDAVADDAISGNKTAGARRRLTRKSRLNKSLQEPSSDFEPGNESEDENESVSGDNRDEAAGDDEDYSSPSGRGRGRKSSRGKGKRSARRSRHHSESGDEPPDPEEVGDELEDLRPSRQPRRRASTPPVLFEETRKRRVVKKVDYTIPQINGGPYEVEDDEAPQASTPARRRGRAAATAYSSRTLHTAAGPFGGISGDGALFTGPWGNGSAAAAAGNADSDDSDDELGARSGAAGTSTGATHGLLGAAAQHAAADGFGRGLAGAAPNVGKMKDHKALADADPLGVDLSVDFSQVGGMAEHIDQLKEMVQLPLLYPELFARFHVTPPRGVLFHGPPGTGKTLLARALANSVGIGGRKITFYMRKGADALSKWVGEAEKQLRLLFEEARRTQPSIIFFDEIDGLAPVRSSKQEQIHASIVSTLLALMDGMDGRGQVIVIGATNRPDNIDPALRRPGRFDREFYFPLPDVDARKSIIDIHTKDWGLSDEFKKALAKDAKGFGGADLRAMCTEAAINSIQRTYPQIYSSKDKLVVDPEKVTVQMTDFILSRKKIIPSSERSSTSGASPLPKSIEPLLRAQFKHFTTLLDNALPRKKTATALEEAMYEPYQDQDYGFEREALRQEFEASRVFRPRLLICGLPGMGHAYIIAGILHYLEGVHVQNFDLPTVLGDVRPAEQVLVGLFTEVKRQMPSVIFIPNVDTWYQTLNGPAMTAFLGMLRSIRSTEPIMVLGTAEVESKSIDPDLARDLFGYSSKNTAEIDRPANREEYFSRVISHIRRFPKDFPDPAERKKRVLEVLPVAPPPAPKVLTKEEINAERIRYRQLLNLMKVHLQPIMDQISKKYQKFRQPVIPESQYQYLLDEAEPNFVRPDVADAPQRPFEIAKDDEGTYGIRSSETGKFFYNLEVGTMETRLANGYYTRPFEFLKDVRALEKDAGNIGDRARWLKASELLANVEVDVTDIDEKFRAMDIDWERLYQVDQARKAQKTERARKRKAMQSVVVQSDTGNGEGPSQKGLHTTTAQFQVIGDLANGTGADSSAHADTNGTSVPSRAPGEDYPMTDVDKSPMQPPSQWPPMQPRSLDTSTRATTGGSIPISQVSAVQPLPLGVSPSALLNDASTTKTSDPSNRSSNFSTQATNGVHHDQSSPVENIPDTQPIPGASQTTSSDEQWPHSQAHGIMRGYIQQPGLSHSSHSQASPAGARSSHAPSMANLLNDPTPDEQSQSQRLSQQVELDDTSADLLLDALTKRTSGCTIEQLEQINRELMSEIWRSRGEHNRMKVLSSVTRVFNEVIEDIQLVQRVLQQSQ